MLTQAELKKYNRIVLMLAKAPHRWPYSDRIEDQIVFLYRHCNCRYTKAYLLEHPAMVRKMYYTGRKAYLAAFNRENLPYKRARIAKEKLEAKMLV